MTEANGTRTRKTTTEVVADKILDLSLRQMADVARQVVEQHPRAAQLFVGELSDALAGESARA